MQITRQADYAIRCIAYLARNNGVSMVDKIAEEMCIPKSFLAKILQKLVKAKMVKSKRGNKGGFELLKRPHEISLYDVIYAIDGPVAINQCAVDSRICRMSATCRVHPIWVEIRKQTEQILKTKTFADFM